MGTTKSPISQIKGVIYMCNVICLPCDAGDTIYRIIGNEIKKDFVTLWEVFMDGIKGYGYETGEFSIDDFNQDVFLNEEHAKAQRTANIMQAL